MATTLATHRMRHKAAVPQRHLSIQAAPGVELEGYLVVPQDRLLRGVIAFPHASRGPRLDVYNRVAVRTLGDAGFAVFLFEAMTPGEKVGRVLPIDLPTVAKRIAAVTESLRGEPETANLDVGYLAAGAGAPGALAAASTLPDDVQAVVALGARPELLEVSLERVTAPVLLIVGGNAADFECGHEVRSRLACQHEIVMVPGSHKLTEGDPRPLTRALQFATQWFGMYLSAPVSQSAGAG